MHFRDVPIVNELSTPQFNPCENCNWGTIRRQELFTRIVGNVLKFMRGEDSEFLARVRDSGSFVTFHLIS